MSVWKRASISSRLAIGLTLVALGAVMVGLAGWIGLSRVGTAAQRVADASSALGAVSDARSASLGVRRFEKDFIINAGDPKEQANYADEWREERDRLLRALDSVARLASDAIERKALADAHQRVERYAAGIERMIASSGSDEKLAARDLNGQVLPVKDEIREVIASLDKISERHAAAIEAETAAAQATQAQTRSFVLLVTALVILAASLVGVARRSQRAARDRAPHPPGAGPHRCG